MSILDTISDAESRALEIKNNARIESREMLKTIESNELNKQKNILDKQRSIQEKLAEEAQEKAKAEREQALKNQDLKDSEFEEQAHVKLTDAVSFVIERIVEQ